MKTSSLLLLAALSVALITGPAAVASASGYDDPFSDGSFWTTPVPDSAARHPYSDQIIDFLAADNELGGCVTLAGAGGNSWGMPIYRADGGDPLYDVRSRRYDLPAEFRRLHIPGGARPADNSDGEMVVYDEAGGFVAQIFQARFDPLSSTWSASGGSVSYLDSDGLHRRAPGATEPRNDGTYRGYNGAVAAVHYDEVAAGKIERVLKVGINTASTRFVFPLVGSDGDSNSPYAPPQGTRLRIKPDVDLSALGLDPQALTIAQGLQEYGMVIGDSTGGSIVLKLEDTLASRGAQKWSLGRNSLCGISIHDFEVLHSGFADVAGHLFRSEIEAISAAGITRGCSPVLFCPDDPLTRGQMAAFLTRALHLPDASSAGFSDTAGSIFRGDIDRLAGAGITRGCSPTRFCPDDPLTRGQMAAFLTRALPLGE